MFWKGTAEKPQMKSVGTSFGIPQYQGQSDITGQQDEHMHICQ